jgi:restriction endonuclease Mrr
MKTSQSTKLQEALHRLPFEAFATLVGKVLQLSGYQDVRLAGRRDWKGRNQGGGVDLLASLPGGISSRRVVVQVKQFDPSKGQRLYQKQVDELRGVALRHKASEAVLVTSGSLSPSIDLFALDDLPVPVRLISGEGLHRLLHQHRLGVTESGELDVSFFEALAAAATGNGPEDCRQPQERSYLVHLRIRPTRKSTPYV